MNTAIQIGRGAEIVEYMTDASVFSKFQDAMDSRSARPFIQSVLLEVARRPELWTCEPESVMVSALQIALLRLSVEPTLGHAYLVPFKDHGIAKCQKIVGYKGLKQLAMRTHMYEALNVTRVWKGESVEVERLSGKVSITGQATSYTEIIGRVAYFKMTDGYEKALAMTTAEIHAHAKKHSNGYDHPKSAWKNPKMMGAMEEKTPFRLLMLRDGYLDPFDMSLVKGEESVPMSNAPMIDAPEPVQLLTGKKARRPDEVKAWLVGRVGELAMRNKVEADAQVRAVLTQKLNECFGDDPMANKSRHDLLVSLTGYATVTNLPGATVRALLEWLVPVRGPEGQMTLDQVSAEEARGASRMSESGG